MKNLFVLALFACCIVIGCVAKAPEPVAIEIDYRKVDYLADVKPILDKRCVVCHSCYNSPCQLKMSSYEGLDRGASKKKIYNATRLKTMDPTRLFIDAESTEEWRKKDFFSISENSAKVGFNNSIMLQLLSHKMKNPKSVGDYFAESDKQSCVETGAELGKYLKEHPNQGMPFGFPPLKQAEFENIALWLSQGAKGPSPTEQEKLTTPKTQDALAIERWEKFLNNPDAKHGMTARYLYEHLFLAHLDFKTGSNEFFELVRSKTAQGEPIQLIATVRPYDDPGVDKFYYRFRKIHSTIVHKTHMVFPMDDAQLSRFEELFIQPEWLQTPHLVDYDPSVSANPFRSFEQMPP
ncbi:MAG: fatty acid cis/trans isomerase, partial [Planctomycetales bacterium]